MLLTDIADDSSCTSCSDDFSNYWTSNLYFRARNGAYKRVPQSLERLQPFFGSNTFASSINGGMLVYYVAGQNQTTAFAPVGSAYSSAMRRSGQSRRANGTC